jgi:ribose 5-phosphate isomerase B
MRIAVASDHAGFELKAAVVEHLAGHGYDVRDLGTDDPSASVDYPDYGAAVGRAVATGTAELGIAICGSGIGIAIAANKVSGVRAALVHDATTARLAREHNHANVLCLGQRVVGTQVALDAVDAWLAATPGDGRHLERIAKLAALDDAASLPPES